MQDKEWVGLVHALKRPEWLKDVRFQTKAGRNVHRNDRLTMMAEVIALWDSQELLERLSKFGVPCGPVNHPRSQVLKDPQVIENDLISIFEKNRIKKINTRNQKFDPNLHQAMSEIEDEQAETGTILQDIQPGYMLGERLLRPALVAVAKKKSFKSEQKDQKKNDK